MEATSFLLVFLGAQASCTIRELDVQLRSTLHDSLALQC